MPPTKEEEQEAFKQYTEAFGFLSHEREDVRKMAIQGIAGQSKNNPTLNHYFVSTEEGKKAVDLILQYFHVGGTALLGDILTLLINVVAEDALCAEVFVQHKIVRKAMRLLDGLTRSTQPDEYVKAVEEMTLMLLNNLTSTHISAVDDLLQNEDEDMRGFYLSKLQVLFDRLGKEEEEKGSKRKKKDDDNDEEEEEEKEDKQEDEEKKKKTSSSSASPARDRRRWILQILLNLTRSKDGQTQLLEDEDWRTTLLDCLQSPNARHRWIAVQCYRNCATATHDPLISLLLKSDVVEVCVRRLSRDGEVEPEPEIQLALVEVLGGVLTTEEGMERLERINARQLLENAVRASSFYHANDERNATVHESSEKVQVVEEEGEEKKKNELPGAVGHTSSTIREGGVVILAKETCEHINKYILPFLDEIVNAYVAPGSDELD